MVPGNQNDEVIQASDDAPLRVLLVDDEADTLFPILDTALGDRCVEVIPVSRADQALVAIDKDQPDVVLLDLHFPYDDAMGERTTGGRLLSEIRQGYPEIAVVVFTVRLDDVAIPEEKFEVEPDFRFAKPDFANDSEWPDALECALRSAIDTARLTRSDEGYELGFLIGETPTMRQIAALVRTAATTSLPVLIIGETGTGKELAARAIHGLSGRTGGFETINCSGIHEETLESELFGHVKGGFTGATAKRAGRFELASGGTLFLDEIQAMPISLQNKLMRVVEDGKIRRMGSSEDISVDVRLVVATNREPDELVDTGQLRGDLAHRFAAGHRIDLPPLRDRLVDIPALFEWFIRSANKDTGKHVRQTLRPEVRKKLETHPWSGNIRELRGVVTRAVAEANSNVLFASDIKFSVKSSQVGSQAAATSGEAPAIPTVMSSGAGTDLPTVAEMLTDQLEALPLEERYEFLKEQAAGLKKAILTELAYRVHTKYGGKVQYRDLAVALDPGPVNDTVLGRIRQLASSCNFKINNLEFTK